MAAKWGLLVMNIGKTPNFRRGSNVGTNYTGYSQDTSGQAERMECFKNERGKTIPDGNQRA